MDQIKALSRQPKRAKIFLIAIVAAIGGFIFGYDVSMMSGAILFLEKSFHLTAAQKGFAMTSAGYGVLIGLLLAGTLSDRLGRRTCVFLAALLFGVSAIGTALPKTLLWWNLFRIVGGVGGGIALVVSPMYISELSPARIRGRMVLMFQIAIVLAILGASVVAYYLSPVRAQWRWMFASELPPILIMAVCLWFIPESPRWLLQKGMVSEAKGILVSFEGEEAADKEVTAIRDSIGAETGKLSELFAPGMRIALLVAVALAVFQQTTGASTLLFYAPTIFKSVASMKSQAVHHMSLVAQNQAALKQAIVVYICLVLFTLLAVAVVDKLGRRPMLLFGAIAMAVGQVLMGILFHLSLPLSSPVHLLGLSLKIPYALVFVVVAVIAYTVSFAPLAWLVMAEIFPTRIRARAMAVATFMLQIAAQVASGLFPAVSKYSKDRFGSEGPTFWLFAAICVIAFFFCLKFVPETKGRTLEEISSSWLKKG